MLGRVYADALVQTKRTANERKAFNDMVARSDIKGKVIVTADRGYETYYTFAHLEKRGWNYVYGLRILIQTIFFVSVK